VVVLAALTTLTTAVTMSTAWAAGTPVFGHDISYPQCNGALPTDGTFGIVGINNGRPFSVNPCLTRQYRWAAATPSGASVYVNTANPAPRSAFHWPATGAKDPALCADSRSRTDPGCAYDYGWHAGADTLARARTVDSAVVGLHWWLDVETQNAWNGDGVSNTAMLQGMYDYLRSHGVTRIGLYSTASQWKRITGGYTGSSAASYKAAWRKEFAAKYALHALPLWIATSGNSTTALAACATSFTGARTAMVQYTDAQGFDTNIIC
jgi:hypothetical protein